MTKEELQQMNLEAETVEKIWADITKNYVAKAQFNLKNEELKTLKEELGKVKTDSSTAEELQKQLEELKASSEAKAKEYEANIHQMKLDTEIEKLLVSNKARNHKAVKALLDMEKVAFKDDKLEGLDEQLEALKQENSFLFEIEAKADPVVNGFNPAGATSSNNNSDVQAVIDKAFGL